MSIVQEFGVGARPSARLDYGLDSPLRAWFIGLTRSTAANRSLAFGRHLHTSTAATSITRTTASSLSFLDGPHTIGQYNNPHNGFSEPGGYGPTVSGASRLPRVKRCTLGRPNPPKRSSRRTATARDIRLRQHDHRSGAGMDILSRLRKPDQNIGSDVWMPIPTQQLDQ